MWLQKSRTDLHAADPGSAANPGRLRYPTPPVGDGARLYMWYTHSDLDFMYGGNTIHVVLRMLQYYSVTASPSTNNPGMYSLLEIPPEIYLTQGTT